MLIFRTVALHIPEYREVHAAVGAVLHEMRVGGEVVLLSVLEDEDATGLQQSPLEDEGRYRRQFGEGVGRVGEDEVVP